MSHADLLPISGGFLFAFLGAGACQPFVTDYVVDQGYPREYASVILAAVYLTFLAVRLNIGRIIGATGLHFAKVAGVATYALFPLLVFALPGYPLKLAAAVLWGIGAPLLWTGGLVQVMNTSAPTHYSTATGIVRATTTGATFVGYYVLSFIYARHGYGALFYSAAAFGLLGIVSMALSPRRTFEVTPPSWATFARLIARPDVKAVCIVLLCSALGYGIVLNGLKGHIEGLYGKLWLERLMPFFALAAILGNIFGGRLCDRIGRWRSIAGGFAAGALGLGLAWTGGHQAVLAAALVLMGLQFAVVPVAAIGWVGDNTRPADRSEIMGYVFCFRDLGVALAILAAGVFPSARVSFAAFAIAYAGCTILAIWAHRMTRVT